MKKFSQSVLSTHLQNEVKKIWSGLSKMWGIMHLHDFPIFLQPLWILSII